ncbi:IS110 family transposase [Polyangium fumosum]|uniref:Uncharacterized protein n=1 Tax=Polyangium fumosum TaxID=889272 RepID=A0A4U1JGE2_9BACT|nr:hypothetical protein E8A74_12720 [Polyangium fumosum]
MNRFKNADQAASYLGLVPSVKKVWHSRVTPASRAPALFVAAEVGRLGEHEIEE